MKRLTVIVHYQELERGGRALVTTGRCLSHEGDSIPWFNLVRKVFVAAIASLCREIAVRESFPATIKGGA